jgi:hypothetical protein
MDDLTYNAYPANPPQKKSPDAARGDDPTQQKPRKRRRARPARRFDDTTGMVPKPDYISMDELLARTPFERQTVYNWIDEGVWIKDVHYFKPRPRVLIFYWPAIEAWIRGEEDNNDKRGEAKGKNPSQ